MRSPTAAPTSSSIPIGGPKAESALRALRWEGRYLVVGFAAGDIPRFPLNQVLLNSRTVIGIELGGWVRREPAGYHALISELIDLVAGGTLHPVEPIARPLARGPGRARRHAVAGDQRQGRAHAVTPRTRQVRLQARDSAPGRTIAACECCSRRCPGPATSTRCSPSPAA